MIHGPGRSRVAGSLCVVGAVSGLLLFKSSPGAETSRRSSIAGFSCPIWMLAQVPPWFAPSLPSKPYPPRACPLKGSGRAGGTPVDRTGRRPARRPHRGPARAVESSAIVRAQRLLPEHGGHVLSKARLHRKREGHDNRMQPVCCSACTWRSRLHQRTGMRMPIAPMRAHYGGELAQLVRTYPRWGGYPMPVRVVVGTGYGGGRGGGYPARPAGCVNRGSPPRPASKPFSGSWSLPPNWYALDCFCPVKNG